MCGATPASSEQVQALQAMRQTLKNTIKASLLDGRFREAIDVIKKEKAATELENMRLDMRATFQTSIVNGRLFQIMAAVKEEKQAKERESMRMSVRNTLQTSLCDGRLAEVITNLKKEKEAKVQEQNMQEVEAMRDSVRRSFQTSLENGRLAEVMAKLKTDKKAKMVKDMRQNLKESFSAAALTGRLSEALATLKEDREANEMEGMRRNLQQNLSASLSNGRLTEVLAALKEKRKAKEVEAVRQNVMQTLQASLFNGRLSEVLSQVKASKKDVLPDTDSAPVEMLPVATPTPTKPTSAKIGARPSRRSSRTDMTVDQQSSVADSSSSAVPVPSPKASMIPPRPPTPVGSSKPKLALGMFVEEASSPSTRLSALPRPASPVGRLPPVAPPYRRQAAAPSAMSLDLAKGSASPSPPSMFSLDFLEQVRTQHSSSLSNIRIANNFSKQKPSFLPPISGVRAATGKASAQKRSASMDSYMWEVAPAIDSHIEWGANHRVVF